MEHWLPLFYERLETVFDYLPDAPIVIDHLAHEALAERHTLILDYYEARRKQADGALKDAVPYKPVPPDLLYLSPERPRCGAGRPREAIDFTRLRRAGCRRAKRSSTPARATAAPSSRNAPTPTSMSSTSS